MRLTHGVGRGMIWGRAVWRTRLSAASSMFESGNQSKAMPARKRRITLDENWRAKIQASQLMNRLAAHVEGVVDLSPTQVRAAEILLKKTVPDLARTEVTGPEGGPQVIRYEWSEPE